MNWVYGPVGYAIGALACWGLFRLIVWADRPKKKDQGSYGPGPWHH